MLEGIHRSPAQERVIFGRSAEAALADEVQRLDAKRLLFVVSRSAAESAQTLAMQRTLGPRLAGTFSAVGEHSPRESVLSLAAAAREHSADLVVAFGGGSVIDACKAALHCVWRGVEDEAGFEALPKGFFPDTPIRPEELVPPPLRMVAIPTTFSGAEFTSFAGVTDSRRGTKEALDHPLQIPRCVILDARATKGVPLWILLSTGVRAIDHCVETHCSPGVQPLADAVSIHALRMLFKHLPTLKDDPQNDEARQHCQLGMWLAIIGPSAGVPVGASHAIGRVMGSAFGVAHGRTSCVLLPSVLRWNATINRREQRELSRALGRDDSELADVVEQLVAEIGEPTRLSQVGVGSDQFGELADKVVASGFARWNPRPVRSRDDVLEILALAR